MMWGWHDSAMLWWMAAGSVFWGVVVVAGIYLITRMSEHDRGAPAAAHRQIAELPLEIARRRYAAGEISEDEFKRLRDNISD